MLYLERREGNKISESVGRIELDLDVNKNGFSRQMDGLAATASGICSSAFGKLGGIIAAAFAVDQIVKFSSSCISLASRLEEVQNVVNVTFGSMAWQINQFAETAIEKLGLSEYSAKKFSSTMGAILKSSGIAGQRMTNMSMELTKLSADMASFYDLKAEDAFYKIQAGITGEIEPLRQLGIVMTQANLNAYAMSQGMGKTYQDMSQAEQILLRYNYLLSVTKDAQGDFARTSGSWANQTRILSEQWNQFKTTLGQGFINILTPVIYWVNVLIQKLMLAAAWFRALTEAIFGSAGASSSVSASVGGVSDAYNGAAGAADKLGNAATKSGEKAKKAANVAKGALAVFDQLNVLQMPKAPEDSGGGAGGAGGGAGSIGNIPEIQMPEINSGKVDAMKAQIDSLKNKFVAFGGYLKDIFGPSFRKVFAELEPVLQNWKIFFSSCFADIAPLAEPLKQWFNNDFIPLLQQTIELSGHIVAGLGDSFLLVAQTAWSSLFPVIEWFVVSGLPLITNFASGVLTVLGSLFDNVKIIFDMIWKDAVDPALKLVSKIVVDTLNMIKGFWDKWGQDIVKGITAAFDNTRKLFEDLWKIFLGPIVQKMLEELKWLWDNHLKAVVQNVLDFVGKLITGALEIYNKFIVPLIDWIVKLLGPAFRDGFKTIIDIFGTLLAAAIDIIGGVIKVFSGIIDFIVGVFTGNWSKAWTGVKEIFGGIWDAIVGALKGCVNLMIGMINNVIRGINRLISGISSIGGGKSWSIPEIPKLAEGGLIKAPTLAVVGDNKNARQDPEVVSPVSKLADLLAPILAANSGNQNNGSAPAGDFIFKIGETEFGRLCIRCINAVHREAGDTLLII